MSEKPPRSRRRKEDELPSFEPNPDLEHLIASVAPKAPEVAFSEKSPQPKEVPSSKDLENLLSKISAENKLTREDAHDIFEKIGGKNASPEALEATTKLIAGKLSGEDYNDYLEEVGSVYPLNVSPIAETTPGLDVVRRKLEQLGDARLASMDEQVSAVNAPENVPPKEEIVGERLPGANPEDLKNFEKDFPTILETVPRAGEDEHFVSLDGSASFSDVQRDHFAELAKDLTPLEARLHLKNLIKGVKKGIRETVSAATPTKRRGLKEEVKTGAEPVAVPPEAVHEVVPPVAESGVDHMPSAAEVAMRRVEKVSSDIQKESKEEVRMSERGERAKAWLSKRSEELQKSAEKYGPKVLGVIEGYNKLNWKTKLAITGGLMLGAGLSVSAGPLVSGAFGAALWGQRTLAGLGTVLNKRKQIDAKIEKDPRSWWANRSEFTKNTYATALALIWTMGSSFAVHEGVEMLKVVGQSDAFKETLEGIKGGIQEGVKKTGELAEEGWSQRNATLQWLREMLSSTPGQETVEGVVSSTTPDSLPTPTPEAEAEALAYVAPEHPEDISHDLSPETVSPSPYSGQYIQETYDKFAWFDRTPEQLQALAKDSLIPDLTAEHRGLIDNHISSLSPAERVSFLQYVEELKNNPKAFSSTGAYPSEQIDDAIGKLKGRLDSIQELTKESAVSAPEVSQAPSPEYQEDLMRSHVKGLNDEWSTLYDEHAQVRSEMASAQAEGSTATVQELSAKEAHIEQRMSDIKQSVEKAGMDTTYGRDPLDGHPMSKQEAQALADLRKSMHDPRSVGAQEKGFLDNMLGWFGGGSEKAEVAPTAQPRMDGVSETLFKGPADEGIPSASISVETEAVGGAHVAEQVVGKSSVELQELAKTSLQANSSEQSELLAKTIQNLSPQERVVFEKYHDEFRAMNSTIGPDLPPPSSGELVGIPREPDVLQSSAPEAMSKPPDEFEAYLKQTGRLEEYEAFKREHQSLNRAPVETGNDASGAQAVQSPEPFGGAGGISESITNSLGLHISTIESHIYEGLKEGELFVFGGSSTDRANAILAYLKENPGKVVFSADNNGSYRIPWYFIDGHIVPGAPVRTSGIFGIGSSFTESPKPEEFTKIIK